MEDYRTLSKESQEILFANVTYETVIDGLNGYFASEPRNDYITVKMESDDIKQDFALYEAEAWADILISWLRTKHGIFYYPGMEAKYAKMERIPPFTERMMDEGALNSLKALYKRVIGQEVGINSHTLIADSIKCAVNAKESAIEKMKERIAELESNFKAVCDEDDIFRTRALKAEEEAKKLKEQLEKAAADYQALSEENQKLKNAEKSDTNKLIREYCTEHGIVAPSRYLSDEACIEYLFSVSVTILQDIYRDIFKRQPDGLSAKDIATKILDRMLTTEDLLHKSVDSVNKECKATGRMMVEAYKIDLKDYILKDIKEHGYRYDGLQTKSIEEIVDWIITMATLDRSSIALRDIYTTVASPVERRRYNIDNCDGAIVDHMKDYILRRFEGLRINIEYCLKKMSELDGCKKDLKILEEQQEFLVKQNSELSCKICAKDGEISRLKDLINAMNEEVKDM